jgi:hypothetical protein
MLLRHRAVPREHHKLDLTSYDPESFSGTPEQRLSAARAAAKTVCDDYAKSIQDKQSDEGYITNKETEIGYVEPKGTTYLDPNKLIGQINQTEVAATGVPFAALGGDLGSYATAYTASGFAIMRAMVIAKIITEGLVELIKLHFRAIKKYTELLDKFQIVIDLLLERDKTEVARRVSVMDNVSVFTDNELRNEFGYPDLTEDQKKEVMDKRILKSRAARKTNQIWDKNNPQPTATGSEPTYPSEVAGDNVDKSVQVKKNASRA